MFDTPAGALVLILAAAFVAPLISSRAPRLRLPSLVFEMVLGIIIGPAVLDLVEVPTAIELLANFGLATLIFLAGFELDFDRVRGRPLRLAITGWVFSVALGLVFAAMLLLTGVIESELYIAFALTTTALGTLLPIISDEGLIPTPFGAHVLAIGSVGEFFPIVAVALLLGGTHTGKTAVALFAFAAFSVVAVAFAARSTHVGHIRRQLARTLRSSGQLYIRLAMLLIALMTFLASELGLDVLLGAFVAGVVYRLYTAAGAPEAELEVMKTKLEAVSFGYLIPVFFVVTGINYDLDALGEVTAMIKLPLFVLALLLVRGLPLVLYRRDIPSRRDRWSLAFFSATGLPLIVAICTIGVATGQMRSSTSAAMMGAGMISVMVFPLVATRLAPGDRSADVISDPAPEL